MRQNRPVFYAFSYLRNNDSQRQYPKKLKKLFDFLGLPGGDDTEQQARIFLQKAKGGDPHWAQENIMAFLVYQRDRVTNKKEITAATLTNMYRPIKLFCEMNGLENLQWKKNSKSTATTAQVLKR